MDQSALVTAWGIMAGSFLIGLSGAVMPGPVLAVAITHSAQRGVKAGPLIVLGHVILESSLVLALVLGLGAYLTRPLVMGSIGAVGGLMLLWMGQDMLRSLPRLSLAAETRKGLSGASGRSSGPVRDGFVLSLFNPYFALWWATVGLSLVVLAMDSGLGWWGLLIFYVGHIGSDLIWYWFVAVVVSKGKKFVNDSFYRGLVGICAVMLIGFAIYFGYFAWKQLAV